MDPPAESRTGLRPAAGDTTRRSSEPPVSDTFRSRGRIFLKQLLKGLVRPRMFLVLRRVYGGSEVSTCAANKSFLAELQHPYPHAGWYNRRLADINPAVMG
ncbi:hypothetical protein [Desulfonema ishimotonii]|uniref:hypothetical protein n=1 Tax=Desulfonema ishimotonii TaxID=45657 RepID=UPI000F5803E2|nr:hypothetical protein [Desulfonema ishimotonii]